MSQARQPLAVNNSEKVEWYVDEKVEKHCKKDLTDHSDIINTFLQLQDGRLASGSDDNTIKIWNIQTGACEKTLTEHKKRVPHILQLQDGRLASGSHDNTIKIWNIQTGTCERTLKGHSSWVLTILQLSDGRLASGSLDNTIKIWNIHTGRCEETLKGHQYEVLSLLQLRDGQLASGSRDETIKIWNAQTRQCETTLTDSGWVYSLIQLPDGRLTSQCWDLTIKIWNIHTGQCETTLVGHKGYVRSLLLLPDGRLASGSLDKTIKIWNIQTGQCEVTLTGHRDEVNSLHLLLNGWLASGSYDKTIKIWNIQTEQCEVTLTGHNYVVYSLLMLSDGQIASRSVDSTIKLWDVGLRNRTKSTPKNNIQSPHQSEFKISYELEYKDLTLGKSLGKGGYGEVFQGTWKQKYNIVAIKELLNKHPSEEAAKEFKEEAKIMAQLKCDYTVQLRGYCGSPHYCLVMEYMPKGSLYNVLHSSERLTWETCYKIIRNMAYGLAYLHSENILHRDLKSLNVLLDEHYKAKLCDFGLSKVKTETQISSSKRTVGTLNWMAPELFKRKAKCTKESDIYSLGLTFWEVVSRKVPFEEARGNQALIQNWIEKGERNGMPDDCPPKLAKLITWCWEQNPTKRPLASQVVDYLEKEMTESTKTSENNNSGPQYRFDS